MNWKAIIDDLMAHHTSREIAALCGCSQATIQHLRSGHTGEPRHALGEKLLGLWRETKRYKREEEPA